MEEEFEEKSDEVFDLMARSKVQQMIYEARKTCISHYFAEQGVRKLKNKIVSENIEENFEVENYLMVSKLSFYVMFFLNCIISS